MASESTLKMDDIARLAGVSASTVSRALSDSPLVAEKTKARIRAIAERFEYQVDTRARSLRLRRTGTVAVIFPLKTEQPLSDPFFMELLGAIADALTERRYQMLLARVASVVDMAGHAAIGSGFADGTILIGQSTDHSAIDHLSRRGAPMIVWGHRLAGQHYASVGSDNMAGGYAAGTHLLQCGYRRLAFIGDPELPEIGARLAGFRRALDVAGENSDRIIVRPTPFVGQIGQAVARQLLQENAAVDAVFAASDLLAISAISAAQSLGRRVPEDLGVVGFDDIQLASYHHPSLTTVRQDIRHGGTMLVEKLLTKLDGEEIESSILPVELVVRESTRSPKGDKNQSRGRQQSGG